MYIDPIWYRNTQTNTQQHNICFLVIGVLQINIMDCLNCNAALPDDAEYCHSCGAAVQKQSDELGTTRPGRAPTEGASQASNRGVTSPPQQSSVEQKQPRYSEQQPQQQRRTRETNGDGGLVSQIKPLGGVIGGVIAFIIALIINSALFVLEATSVPGGSTSGGVVSQVAAQFSDGQVVSLFGWLFYNAHTIGVSFSSAGESQTLNILDEIYRGLPANVSTVPQVLYTIVPILVLLLAGYILARGAQSAGSGAVRGVSVTAGYLILAIGGGLTVFASSTRGISASPELGSTVIIMGIVFPVIAGGVGGALAGQTPNSR